MKVWFTQSGVPSFLSVATVNRFPYVRRDRIPSQLTVETVNATHKYLQEFYMTVTRLSHDYYTYVHTCTHTHARASWWHTPWPVLLLTTVLTLEEEEP